MSEFLLELLCEEIPARMQLKAAQNLKEAFITHLKAIDVSYSSIETFVTPRRLTVMIQGLPESTQETRAEKRGPRLTAPEAALEGFLKGADVSKAECEQRDGYWYALLVTPSQKTVTFLPEMIRTILREFSWQKSMRWAGASQLWVRPLRGILALFDGKLIPFEVPEFMIQSSRTTIGHRFLSPHSLEITSFEDYRQKLSASHVMLSHQERQRFIEDNLIELGKTQGYTLEKDPQLLEEVAGLVECPQPLVGTIDQKFMHLPKEVLGTSMRVHQKYFTFVDAHGNIAPVFGFAANTIPTDGGTEMLKGYQRVLSARLTDAAFFYDQDLSTPLAENIQKLDNIIFHAQLGTLGQRVNRLEALVDSTEAKRAARLCKGDLVSSMVGEFPELQGIMGQYYTRVQGESDAVTLAIREHYQPQGPLDNCPSAPTSIELALVEKLDTLVGFFMIGELPTGSKDPYALRRAALGIIRLIRENELSSYPLKDKIHQAIDLYTRQGINVDKDFDPGSILGFIRDRLSHALKGEGLPHDRIAAVLCSHYDEANILALTQRAQALDSYLKEESGIALQAAFRRAYGILSKENYPLDTPQETRITVALFEDKVEQALYALLTQISQQCQPLLENRRYGELMRILSTLHTPVDRFFDLKINDDRADIRANRFALLGLLVQKTALIADFSKLEGA